WNGTGYSLFQGLGSKAGVRAVTFSSDSMTLAAAGYDKVVRIFKFKAGSSWTFDQELLGHKYHVLALAFAPGGNLLVSAGGLWPQKAPGEVRIWFGFETKHLGELHGQNVNALAFSPDGKFLATTCADRYLRVWRTDPEFRTCPLDPDKC